MKENKKTGETPESIKKRLFILFNMNKKRKSALEKLSKSFLENENKTSAKKQTEKKINISNDNE